jgi:hypothetical protein
MLDIGGESTRPGADTLGAAHELTRVLPVLREAVRLGVPVSVDTSEPLVMREAAGPGGGHRQRRACAAAPWRAGLRGGAPEGRGVPDAHAGRTHGHAGRPYDDVVVRGAQLPGSACQAAVSRWRGRGAHRARPRASASPRRRTTIWNCCAAGATAGAGSAAAGGLVAQRARWVDHGPTGGRQAGGQLVAALGGTARCRHRSRARRGRHGGRAEGVAGRPTGHLPIV